MRYRALLSSSPGCGLSVPIITSLPWRRGSCLGADTVVSSSLWREGHSITSHISHPSVEEVGIALSHTLGSSSWRGWALHYPTHRASACGGDGHRVLPHIGQALPGSGRLLCNGWVAPKGPHCMITRGSCSVDIHAALQLGGAVTLVRHPDGNR